jgi:hypothetical protein
VAVAQHTARSCSAETPKRRNAWHVPLASGQWPACNEIKLLVKEFGTDRTAVTGTLALQDARRRSQSNEEDR